MPLFVWVLARALVLAKASNRGLGTTTIYLSTWYILDVVDVPPDRVGWCPVVSQVAMDLITNLIFTHL